MLDPVAVESSSVAHLSYDSRRAILQVEFRDGTAYQYAGVPLETYEDLLGADSKGAYFNHHIRNLYPHATLCRRPRRIRLNKQKLSLMF